MTSVDPGSAASGDAVPLAVDQLDANARRLAVLRVGKHHVGDVDRPLLVDHAAALSAAGPDLLGLLVALDHVQALHVNAVLLRVDAQHLAALPAILAADHD